MERSNIAKVNQELDNRNVMTFSKCQMYDKNFTTLENYSGFNDTNLATKDCSNGYIYDKTWYETTITTQEDWVCEKELYVTNTFVFNRISEVVGALFLGQLGDAYGRRFVYYIGVVLSTVGRFVCIFTPSSFTMFVLTSSLAALTVNSLFQSPAVIAMEISGEDERSNIAMYQSVGWFLGTTFMPFFYWWLRDWIPFLCITTLPTALVLFFYKYAIESPRWLISKRRFADALVQLKRIAYLNRRSITITEKELVELYGNLEEEKVIGVASLFSGWRIAKNTIIMGFSWCVLAISYFTLVLFSSRMGGNPFLNFSLQNFVELPACIVGKYLGDRYGRRLTNSISYLICFFACFPVIVLFQDSEYKYLMTLIAAFIKFLTAVVYFLLSLQSVEIYPTCLRQTGIALGTILYNSVGVLAPYLVHLGTKYDIRYPYLILGLMFLVAGVSGFFLPETLHNRLPDTLEEAKAFGKNQKFFSLPKPRCHHSSEDEKLNQTKYAP
ncbi:carcinine transporter-like isoform X2 [Eupeodes corollae]|uniref:carcinine transporter-like isoform X2 n=1 Tax=Eupeodes corollae TaxID=290404 RepID=UPI0024937F93|nr:carcinine transporter-like isoform X2 [Eupeodes corollae]